MFPDLSWSHMLLVLIVALVVVGPKDLPKLMRKMGQWTAKARGMADQFRRSFDEMARQSELDELRKELEDLKHERPLADVDQKMSAMLSPPAVSLEPDVKAGPDPVQPELALEPPGQHVDPPPSPEPAEPIPAGDLHPPPP